MQQKILLLPCNGKCPEGKITWLAAQELVLEHKAQWCISWQQLDQHLNAAGENQAPFIIVEGCDNRCLLNELLEEGLVGKHHMALSDVGIAPTCYDEISREEIELAKEAIIAECQPVNRSTPPLFPGCCCR